MNALPNILIVDDTFENISYLKAIIKDIKVNLIQAYSGFEALEKTEGVELALAIIDVRMPGMNGYELATKLNQERINNKVPVIFLTANYFNEREVFIGYDHGAVDYIFKPVEKYILISKINIFLDLFEQKRTIANDKELLRRNAEDLQNLNQCLKSSEEKYRSYIDNAPDGVFILNEEGRYIEVNEAACQITGYSKSELFDITFIDLLSEESKDVGLICFQDVNHIGKSRGDLMFKHKKGTKHWLAVEFVKLSETNILCFKKDITERKQAEELLRESEEKYHVLFKANKDSISILSVDQNDSTSDFIELNDTASEIFGKEDFKFSNLNDINTTESIDIIKERIKLLNTKGSVEFETIIKDKEGNDRNIDVKVVLINYMGKPSLMSISKDITERKKAEYELKKLNEELEDRVKERTTELLNVTIKVEERERNRFSRELHDGLGPLFSTIKLYFQWLTETQDVEKIKIITEKGNYNIDRAIQTIREVSFGLSSSRLNNAGFVKAVSDFIENINVTKKIDIFFNYNYNGRFSIFLEISIYRITTELINNTLKYAKASKVEISFNYNEIEKNIEFSYFDNGIGFDLSAIHNNNKGLGLMNIEQRIKILNGDLKIQTSFDNGFLLNSKIPITDNIFITE